LSANNQRAAQKRPIPRSNGGPEEIIDLSTPPPSPTLSTPVTPAAPLVVQIPEISMSLGHAYGVRKATLSGSCVDVINRDCGAEEPLLVRLNEIVAKFFQYASEISLANILVTLGVALYRLNRSVEALTTFLVTDLKISIFFRVQTLHLARAGLDTTILSKSVFVSFSEVERFMPQIRYMIQGHLNNAAEAKRQRNG
jgi:hypothetical protein